MAAEDARGPVTDESAGGDGQATKALAGHTERRSLIFTKAGATQSALSSAGAQLTF